MASPESWQPAQASTGAAGLAASEWRPETVDGTAEAGTDYVYDYGTLSWAAGDDTSKSFTIDLLGDEFLETVKTGDPITIRKDGTVEVG